MGMYTEIYVNIDFKKDIPKDVLDVIAAMCNNDWDAECLKDKPKRWSCLFNNGSYYTALTSCKKLTYDDIREGWSLLAKGDIKNYDEEIQKFFNFIKPWADDDDTFIGYYRYEECKEPVLVYSDGAME